LIDWVGELINNILLVAFLAILFATFIYIGYKSYKKTREIAKEKKEQKKACREAKRLDWWRRHTDYFWANPWLFIVYSLGFFMFYTLSLFLYEATGIWLFILIFILYLVFVKYTIIWYRNFPKVAAQRLEEHENALIANVCKEINIHTDKINELLSTYSIDKMDSINLESDCKKNLIKHPTDVEKFDFPPFIKLDGPKKSVIKSRQMQFAVLERDFMLVCLNPTKFDLLNPPRGDLKKKCNYKRGAGSCFDIFYSEIKQVVYEDGGIKIYFWDRYNKDPIVIKVAKEEDAKPDILKIRQQIRMLEHSRLSKIEEILHFERVENSNIDNKVQEQEVKLKSEEAMPSDDTQNSDTKVTTNNKS